MNDSGWKLRAAIAYQQHRYLQAARDIQSAWIEGKIDTDRFRGQMKDALDELIHHVFQINAYYRDDET